jgi:hypothetical protein
MARVESYHDAMLGKSRGRGELPSVTARRCKEENERDWGREERGHPLIERMPRLELWPGAVRLERLSHRNELDSKLFNV